MIQYLSYLVFCQCVGNDLQYLMNFIIKSVLKKIFTQYLYIKDDGLDLTSGVIKLPLGNLNHQRINEKLKPFGIKVNSSSYKNLIIHLPLVELLSKPIRISIEVLDIVIQKVYGQELAQISKIENIAEQQNIKLEKQEIIKGQNIQTQSGYFRNIINRLLYNMEILMDKINIRFIDSREEQAYKEAYFTLNSFILKNSLVILEANLVKKTLTLDELHLKHVIGQIIVKDISLCLDFSNKKLHVICVGHTIKFNLFNLPLELIRKNIRKEKKVQKKLSSIKQLQQVSLYLKLNKIDINLKLVNAIVQCLELKHKQSAIGMQASLSFGEIKLVNASDQLNQNHILLIGYLPYSKLVKINTQFEDSAIKQALILFKQQFHETNLITSKIYHLSIQVQVNQFQILLDRLIQKSEKVESFGQILSQMKNKDPNQQIIISQNGIPSINKILADILIYRVFVCIQYSEMKVELFCTSSFQIKEDLVVQNKKVNRNIQSMNEMNKRKNIVSQLKIYQLGARVFNYKVIQILDLNAKMITQQVTVNISTITFQVSLALIDQIIKHKSLLQRDSAYYFQKIQKILKLRQLQGENIPAPNRKENAYKLYIKVDEMIIGLGELIQMNKKETKSSQQIGNRFSEEFISIIDVQLTKTMLSLRQSKLKMTTEMITFIYSPYTLQKTSLTNELQLQLIIGLQNSQFNLSFKNKLIFLLQDHYINIFYKLLDKKDVWCFVNNKTQQAFQILQETKDYFSIFSMDREASLEDQRSFYSIDCQHQSRRPIFWLGNGQFCMVMGNKKTNTLNAKFDQYSLKNSSNFIVKQLFFNEQKQYDYILKLKYNTLNNLFEIIIDYKILISSYCKDYYFQHGNKVSKITASKNATLEWFTELEDIIDDYLQYSVRCDDKWLKIDQLMMNQSFNLMGIYEMVCGQKNEVGRKMYDSYIHLVKIDSQIKMTIMPFLIINNNSIQDLQLEIIDKKSQQKQLIILKRNQNIQLGNNLKFDYYLKQFTIKISVIERQTASYESEYVYFNTFFMVEHKTQTVVVLRSTQKSNFSKKSLILQQSLLLKTKTISFKDPVQINNTTNFTFSLLIHQPNKQYLQKLDLNSKEIVRLTHRLKQDTIIQFYINKLMENRIEFKFGDIKQVKIMSFNFCKIQDRYFNVFIKIQRRFLEGIETIILDYFIEIIDLCLFSGPISIKQVALLLKQQRVNLPLNSTTLSKYNNKLVQLDDISRIYAQIFLTAKVTDQPLCVQIDGESIKFSQFLKQSSQQLRINQNSFIITLLKDMNNNKITFYLTDRLFNQKLHYTIFNNQSKDYFLLTDDFQYAPHFFNKQSQCPTSPQKIFISKNSFNTFLNRQHYDILLCDESQKHLEKIDKKVIEKQSLLFQQFTFDSLTLFDCCNQEENESIRKQFTTKEMQLRIRMYGKMDLSFSFQSLTVRLLQSDKVDCLIQDISIKNEATNDYLLRIPQQTYFLAQGRLLHHGYFIFIKNLFVKCKNIIINIKRQMPYSLVELMGTLSERLGLNHKIQLIEHSDPRRYREQIKKLNGEQKLKRHIKQPLLLIRNLYIHQIHLSLTIELQNLSFSNVIILPFFEFINRFERLKNFTDNLTNFYLTTLLAKFPKLSFLMSNFRSPINTFRLFFNIREAMKKKIESEPLICFDHSFYPNNPFQFSVQRWNFICQNLQQSFQRQQTEKQTIISYIFQGKKCIVLTKANIYIIGEQPRKWLLRQLQTLKLIKNRLNSELILRMKTGQRISIVQEHKKCIKILNTIEKLLL